MYIPGCPPRPEAIIDGIIKLRKKISNDSLAERQKMQQTHRYYTIPHNMKLMPSAHTGEYLRSPNRKKPPAILAEEKGIPLPELLRQWESQKTGQGSED